LTSVAPRAPGFAWSRSDFLRHPIVTITKLDWPNTDATAMPIAGAYPDPYPAPWPRLCQVTHGRARSYRDPGGSRSPRQVFYETRRLAVPSVIGVAPMPPPRDVRIDGRDADFGGHLRADEPHTLTWTGSPLATQYEVTLYRVRPGMPHRIHMAITTPSTKLTLPAEFLTGNDYLVFQVTAIAAQNDVAGGDLLPNGIPLTTAATVSALFRVSSTCGDGQLDVGEDCDARGESATCDVDCTRGHLRRWPAQPDRWRAVRPGRGRSSTATPTARRRCAATVTATPPPRPATTAAPRPAMAARRPVASSRDPCRARTCGLRFRKPPL
jgi:hypothetical protein